MLDNSASIFRPVALGTAAENKRLRGPDGNFSKMLLVSPVEKLPFMDGEQVDRVDAVEYEGVDAEGKVQAGTAFVSNNINAHWLPETNRRTPPDVQRGERIILYQYANNDKYYWRCMGMDDNLRRLETVIVGINANPNMGQDGIDPENMYFVEFSSHSKTITLSTSQKNGEVCTYDMQFDMGVGKFVLQDSLGNYGQINSPEYLIELKNGLGTFFQLNKQDIIGFAPRNIALTATNNVDVKANKITLNGGGSQFELSAAGTILTTPVFTGVSGSV
ncbi:hypothetical protein D9M68_17550 [compost metagenome]